MTSQTMTRLWASAVECEPVDGLGGDGDRGVEAEGVVGAGEVVVDGLRDPDHPHAQLVEAGRHAERVLAADGHDRADVVADERVHHDLRAPRGA
jgi:hypothetical protein